MSASAPRIVLAGLALALLAGVRGHGQAPAPGAKVTPRLEPVAETRLLMEGLAHANFRGLERLLAQPPADAQAWTFARGQALLLAETGNLLMLRPPRNQGQPVWFERATELRGQATKLALALAQRDYAASRAGLQQVAGTCNRCHHTFRVDVEIAPFAPPPPPKVE
jgi:Cytochrome C'